MHNDDDANVRHRFISGRDSSIPASTGNSWSDAEVSCNRFGGGTRLAAMDSSAEIRFVQSLLDEDQARSGNDFRDSQIPMPSAWVGCSERSQHSKRSNRLDTTERAVQEGVPYFHWGGTETAQIADRCASACGPRWEENNQRAPSSVNASVCKWGTTFVALESKMAAFVDDRYDYEKNMGANSAEHVNICALRCRLGPALGFDVIKNGSRTGRCYCRTVVGGGPLDCEVENDGSLGGLDLINDIGRYDYVDARCSNNAAVSIQQSCASALTVTRASSDGDIISPGTPPTPQPQTHTACLAHKAAVCELALDPEWHVRGDFKYAYINVPLSWHDANASCIALGAGAGLLDFEEDDADEEEAFVISNVTRRNPMPFWTGCHAPGLNIADEIDRFPESQMKWTRSGRKCGSEKRTATWKGIIEQCWRIDPTRPLRERAMAGPTCIIPIGYVCKAPADEPEWKVRGEFKYFYGKQKSSWSDARLNCKFRHNGGPLADLVSIESQGERDFVAGLTRPDVSDQDWSDYRIGHNEFKQVDAKIENEVWTSCFSQGISLDLNASERIALATADEDLVTKQMVYTFSWWDTGKSCNGMRLLTLPYNAPSASDSSYSPVFKPNDPFFLDRCVTFDTHKSDFSYALAPPESHFNATRSWSDAPCYFKKTYVCKAPAKRTVVTDSEQPAVVWHHYNNQSFFTHVAIKKTRSEDGLKDGLSWAEARSKCAEIGGRGADLATVDTKEKEDFMISDVINFTLLDVKSSGLWMGCAGSTMYTNASTYASGDVPMVLPSIDTFMDIFRWAKTNASCRNNRSGVYSNWRASVTSSDENAMGRLFTTCTTLSIARPGLDKNNSVNGKLFWDLHNCETQLSFLCEASDNFALFFFGFFGGGPKSLVARAGPSKGCRQPVPS